MSAVARTVRFLADFPGAGAIYPARKLQDPPLRKWRVDSFKDYLIFYRDMGVSLDVVRVIHGKRDIPRILNKL